MKKRVLMRAASIGMAAFLTISTILSGGVGNMTAYAAETQVQELVSWEFDTDESGWYYDAGWEYQYSGTENSSVIWDEEKKMLKANLDYSKDSGNSWSQTGVSIWNDEGMNFAGVNQISFDFYYDTAMRREGTFAIKAYSEKGGFESFVNINEETAETVEGTLKKARVVIDLEEEATEEAVTGFTLAVIGVNTDYMGCIWLDNIKLSSVKENTIVDTEQFGFDFEDGVQGFYYAGWEYNYTTPENSGVTAENGRLKISGIQFDAQYDWANFAIANWNETGFAFDNASKITMDVLYPAESAWNGNIKLGIYAQDTTGAAVIDAYADVSGAVLDESSGMMKTTVTVPFESVSAAVQQLAVKVIGTYCDFSGDLYLDNIKVVSQVDTADKSIDATVAVNAGNPVAVSGNKITTMKADGTTENVVLASEIKLVDKDASDDVKKVYAYLQAVGQTDSVIYGHQNDTWHKAGSNALSSSDTVDVTGSVSGVIGIDTLSLTGNEYSATRFNAEIAANNETIATIDTEGQAIAKANVQAAAALTNINIGEGAIITLSAHMPNFSVVKENPNYNEAADPTYAKYDFSGYTPNTLSGDVVNEILPGGTYHEVYNAYLDMIADYASQVNGAILFRPFHECTGSWFWWGAAFCNAEQYKNVFRYTVEYLRDTKDIHNLIYVYGPGSEAESVEAYGERYPGDAYVDMVGFDMYDSDPATDENGYSFMNSFKKELQIVDQFAKEHGKLIAVTETGLASSVADAGHSQTVLHEQGNNQKDWYNKLMNVVSENSDASYLLLWANFGKKDGYYTPYVDSVNSNGTLHGHEMLDNFITFYNDNRTIFAKDQKAALGQINGSTITANAAASEVTGYITAPIAGRRILNPMTLTARVSGVTGEAIKFVLIGENEVTLQASVTDGKATAELTQADLEKLGVYADGKIKLCAGTTELQTISAICNIPEPEEDPYEIDGFENYYGVDTLLTKKWATNKASGSTISLSLTKEKEKCYDGDYAMVFHYRETSDGWAGATISKEVNWSECNALRFYTIPDGKNQKTVIQLTANGVVYEAYLNLYEDYAADTDGTPLLVTIPFTDFCERDTAGNPKGGLLEDSASVTSFGLWVNAIADSAAIDADGMVEGTIIYDKITAVKTSDTVASFSKIVEEPSGDETEKPDGGEAEKPDGGEAEKPDGGETEKPDGGETEKPNGGETEKPDGGETGTTDGDETEKTDGDKAEKQDEDTADDSDEDAAKEPEEETTEESDKKSDKESDKKKETTETVKKSDAKWSTIEKTEKNSNGVFIRTISNGMVRISATGAIIPAGTQMKTEILTSGNEYEKVAKAVADYLKGCKNFKAYEISLRNSAGKELHELEGNATVTLSVPKDMVITAGNTITVYRLAEDGTLVKCATEYKDGEVSFTTNHFSTFILAEETISAPQTSDNSIGFIVAIVGLILCGIACVAVGWKKYRKTNE